MNTTRKLVISAVATLGLFVSGAVNSANAGHPGKEMGHGPVVNSSGKIGKESGKHDKKYDKEHKEWEYKNHYSYRYDYCSPTYSYPVVETCAPVCEVPVVTQPVCEVPVCEVPVCVEPVYVPTTCYEYPSSYEVCKPYDYHKSGYSKWHHENSKPTTASSHRNTENLGGSGSKPTTASSHRSTQNLGSVASNTAGRGRK